jgi:hypothetical protein
LEQYVVSSLGGVGGTMGFMIVLFLPGGFVRPGYPPNGDAVSFWRGKRISQEENDKSSEKSFKLIMSK